MDNVVLKIVYFLFSFDLHLSLELIDNLHMLFWVSVLSGIQTFGTIVLFDRT